MIDQCSVTICLPNLKTDKSLINWFKLNLSEIIWVYADRKYLFRNFSSYMWIVDADKTVVIISKQCLKVARNCQKLLF